MTRTSVYVSAVQVWPVVWPPVLKQARPLKTRPRALDFTQDLVFLISNFFNEFGCYTYALFMAKPNLQ